MPVARLLFVSLVWIAVEAGATLPLNPLVETAVEYDDNTFFDVVPGDILDSGDQFGAGVAWLGDLDGGGAAVSTIAVGAWKEDDGPGTDPGAV